MQPSPRILPFAGALTLEILQATQTSLHGDVYFDLLVREAGNADDDPFLIRVARDACATSPTPGAIVRATFLAGQLERLTSAAS